MVNLKYIENPFEEKIMNSIAYFSEEKSFYDCVNRKFLSGEAFQHLENTFYTYLLTGDSKEWIGYVLFSNEDRVNSYYQYAYQITLYLLHHIRTKYVDELKHLEKLMHDSEDTFDKRMVVEEVLFSLKKISVLNFLESLESELAYRENKMELINLKTIIEKDSNPRNMMTIVDKVFSLLVNLGVKDCCCMNNMLLNYQDKLQNYLENFPNYFYLDIVIALPKEEEIYLQKENNNFSLNVDLLAELKYYGFIQEVFNKVEKVIQQRFKNIPILVKRENEDIYLVNSESLSDDKKQLMKQIKNVFLKNQ